MTFDVASPWDRLLVLFAFLGAWHCTLLSIMAVARIRGAARWYLGGAFAGLGYVQVSLTLLSMNLGDSLPFWMPFQFPLASLGMAIAPCFYLCVRHLLRPGQHPNWKDALHFLPAAIQFCMQIPVLLAGPLRSALVSHYMSTDLADSFIPGVELPRVISLVYFGLVVHLLWTHSQRTDGAPTPPFSVACAVASTQAGLCLLIPIFSSDAHAWLRPVGIGGVTTVLVVSIATTLISLRARPAKRTASLADAGNQITPFTSATAGNSLTEDDCSVEITEPTGREENGDSVPADRISMTATGDRSAGTAPDDDEDKTAASSKYETSPLSAEQKERFRTQIIQHMDAEEPYLDGDLTLRQMADQIDLPARYISQVINEQLGQSFTEWVNEHRVDAAKDLLADEAYQHLTVIAVAHEAGFNSKSTFYSAFKRQAGTTPAAYRRKQQASSVA